VSKFSQIIADFAPVVSDLGTARTIAQVTTQLKTIVEQLAPVISDFRRIIVKMTMAIIRRRRGGYGKQSADHQRS
jgi:hypothetical protein